MAIIRPPISGDSPQDSWMNQVTEAINKGLLAPSVNPSEAAVISVDSFSAATVYLYTRTTTATAPAVLTQDLTYDYSQASFTTSPPFGSANWETSPPGIATGDYLWVITVNISANVGQEIIPAASWSTPQIFSVNGSSSIVIEAYLRASSAPSTPTGGSYNFTTKILTPPAGGWTQAFPSGSDPVYIVTAIATVVGSDGVDSSLTWSAPVKMVEDGATGASTNIIFQRSSTQPSTPSGSPGVPSGWYDDASSAPGTALLWASSGVKPINVSNFTWSTPFRIEGESVAEVAVYRLNSNVGLTGGTYNFVTNTLTPPSSWLTSSPAITNNGDTIYRSSGIASGSAKETSAAVTFGPAVIFAQRNDGTDATDVESGLVYYNQASTNNPGTPSATDYNFTTGVFSGLTSGWQTTPVTVNITTTTALFWSSRFRIIKAPNAGTPTIIFDTPIPSVNFGTNIQSDNYITGTSGWQIQRASGDAEFNNIDIRGNVEATSWDGSTSTGVYITPLAGRLYDSYDTFSTTPTSLASGSWTLSNHYNFANNPSNTVITPASWNDFIDSPSNRRIIKFRKDSSATRFIANLVPGDTISIYLNYPTYSNTFANFNISEAGFITSASNNNDYGYLVLSSINGSTTFQWAGTSTSLKVNTALKFYPGNAGYTFQKNGDAAINGGTLNVTNLVVEGTLSASNINAGLIVNTASGVSGGYSPGGPWYKSVELVASNSPDYISNILYSIIGHAFFETQVLYVALVRVYPGYVSYAQSQTTFSTSYISTTIGGIGYISGVPWCQTVDFRSMPGRSPGFSGGHISLVSGLVSADPTSLYMVLGRINGLYQYVDVSGQLQEIREEV